MQYEILKAWAGHKVGEKITITDKAVIKKALEEKVIGEPTAKKK